MAELREAAAGERRLGRVLLVFFLALAIPTVILVRQAYSQIKWEVFHQSRLLAEELSLRINDGAQEFLRQQNERAADDFAFAVTTDNDSGSLIQRSPLSGFPVDGGGAGLLGYFQIDAGGTFSTPLLPVAQSPAQVGIAGEEVQRRQQLQSRLLATLQQNRLASGSGMREAALEEEQQVAAEAAPVERRRGIMVGSVASSEPAAAAPLATTTSLDDAAESVYSVSSREQERGRVDQAGFDLLRQKNQALESAADRPAPLEKKVSSQRLIEPPSPASQKEDDAADFESMPVMEDVLADAVRSEGVSTSRAVSTFDSDVEPYDFSLLGSGHFVLFRNVWRNGERLVQGLLLDRDRFLEGVFGSAFSGTVVSERADLIVSYEGVGLRRFSGDPGSGYPANDAQLAGEALFNARLSPPFGGLEVSYRITRLPSGPGASLVTWAAAVLAAVLCLGSFFIYRLGRRQIELARQQQDFVSAVSHELKTPLTSIRMYGEMLREGWAPEEKKKAYYDYIFAESERLSRLIANVLQLARLTRRELELDLQARSVTEVVSLIESKIDSQLESSGFEFALELKDQAGRQFVRVDDDAVVQVFINLVDNAVKFSARAEQQRVELTVQQARDSQVEFRVRDYGPGVPRDQMRRIFSLFYRSETELTRETVGTGIGLALVRELVSGMAGSIEVRNRDPGAEFAIRLPVVSGPN